MNRALAAVLVAAGLVFYAANAVHYVREPLRIEEGEWPPMARAIVHHGRPLIPQAEDHRLRLDPATPADAPLRWDRSDWLGAWHPPLYQYALAAVTVAAGDDASRSLRIVGVLGLLASCALLFLIARELARERWELIGAAASALLLVHPYAIQASAFIDIDTTLYPPALLLVLWLALRLAPRPGFGLREVLLLGGALALAAWVKLVTLPVLIAVLGIYWLLARQTLRAVAELAAAVLAGAVMFVATYALWCAATGIAFSYTFDFTFGGKSKRLFDSTAVDGALKWNIPWVHPALLALLAAYGIEMLVNYARTRRVRGADLLWGFGVAVLIQYTWVSPNGGIYQGKYAAPALPALALAVAWLCLRRAPSRLDWRALAAAGAVGVVAAVLLPDLLTNQPYLLRDAGWRAGVVAGSFGAVLAGWLAGRVLGRTAAGALVAVAILLVAQSVHSYRSDVSPLYPIADTRDFVETVRTVNAHVGPGDVALVSKDVGFYVRPGAYVIEGHDTILRGDALTARAMREDPRIKVWAQNTFGAWTGPAMAQVLDSCFKSVDPLPSATIRARTSC